MRHLLLLFLVLLTGLTVCGRGISNQSADHTNDLVVSNDSSFDIIAWFCKKDTVKYRINTTRWKVKQHDTVKTASTSMNVMLTVADSTQKGYTIDYTFLDFMSDSLPNEQAQSLQNNLVASLGSRLKGTTIRFRTNEYGTITGYDNIKAIRKQACKYYREVVDSFVNQNLIDGSIANLMKDVDEKELIYGYIEELELLFRLHGKNVEPGELKEHEPATETQYESDSEFYAYNDTVNGIYGVSTYIDNYIPASETAEIVGNVVKSITGEEMPDEAIDTFKQIKEPLILSNNYIAEYWDNGWPRTIINQKNQMFKDMGQGQLQQTKIDWDYISTANY